MVSTITARYVLACATFALLACGEGPGGGRDTIPDEAADISRRNEVMNQAEQDRRVDYIEFLATDLEETRRFYSEVFGWEFTDYGPEYTSFTDGRLSGGFALAPEVSAGGPLIVLYATNLEDVEASIRESGGRIVRAVFDFPGGRRFHFTDPGGNELAVWSDR